jgi:drug/metabolite transporter (DMT)-like permease
MVAESAAAQRRGAILVAASAAAFGALPIFARMAYDAGVDLYGMLVPRFVIGAAVLGSVALLRDAAFPRGRALAAVAAMGAVGYTGQSFLYFTALRYADASLVALLLYSYPFLVALLAAAFLGERLSGARVAALVLAGCGLTMTIGGGHGSALGVALGLGAAALYSVYIVVGARVLRGVDPIAASSVICAAAAVSYGLLAAASAAAGVPIAWPATAGGLVPVVALSLVSTALAIATFFAGLRLLGATLTSVLSTLEPVVSVALAAVVLGEQIGLLQALGGTVVIGTAIWMALRPPPPA